MNWFSRRRLDRHALLVQDIDRTRLFMRAVIADARKLNIPVPAMIVVSVTAWAEWLDQIQD